MNKYSRTWDFFITKVDSPETGTSQEPETLRTHYRHLEEWARSIYTVRSIDYHWSTQDIMSDDNVPLIGRITPDSEHSYVATGFQK
jgi:glycine/D-amino acid oxidase-like deaminating enzyme